MKAIITGIAGMDGSYLAEMLLNEGYEVHGVLKSSSDSSRIDSLDLNLHYFDITEEQKITQLIDVVNPDEFYNFAAQSKVAKSFESPLETIEVNYWTPLKIFEHMRIIGSSCKFYQASSSEMFGGQSFVGEISHHGNATTVNESSPLSPRSPYGVSKSNTFLASKMYRQAYGMFICNGILFNHEGERRGDSFVTQKIVKGLARYLKTGEPVNLHNVHVLRDWGYAPDYVEGIYAMMQHDTPDDYVLATGVVHSVLDFVEEACRALNITNVENAYTTTASDRPVDLVGLRGDASKALKILKWKPKRSFEDVVRIMAEHA